MSSISTVTVTVPATTANLGPGFDCIGAALTLYNQFKFTRLDESSRNPTPTLSASGKGEKLVTTGEVNIIVSGAEADRVDAGSDNLAYQAYIKLYRHLGLTPPPVQIEIDLGVPLARGLGSSATAIVGGLVAANALAGSPLAPTEVMELAIAIEGHPDNVVPALLGGCRLAATSLSNEVAGTSLSAAGVKGWEICDIPWHDHVVPVVAIPDFELSTAEARQVLPDNYTRADAIFNTAHLGLLLRGLETGKGEWLQAALQDKIHQPYRKALIAGYDAVRSAAMAAGAYGMVISGAGPTLLAITDAARSAKVAAAMTDAWKQEGVSADVRSLQIDSFGAKCFTEPSA